LRLATLLRELVGALREGLADHAQPVFRPELAKCVFREERPRGARAAGLCCAGAPEQQHQRPCQAPSDGRAEQDAWLEELITEREEPECLCTALTVGLQHRRDDLAAPAS